MASAASFYGCCLSESSAITSTILCLGLFKYVMVICIASTFIGLTYLLFIPLLLYQLDASCGASLSSSSSSSIDMPSGSNSPSGTASVDNMQRSSSVANNLRKNNLAPSITSPSGSASTITIGHNRQSPSTPLSSSSAAAALIPSTSASRMDKIPLSRLARRYCGSGPKPMEQLRRILGTAYDERYQSIFNPSYLKLGNSAGDYLNFGEPGTPEQDPGDIDSPGAEIKPIPARRNGVSTKLSRQHSGQSKDRTYASPTAHYNHRFPDHSSFYAKPGHRQMITAGPYADLLHLVKANDPDGSILSKHEQDNSEDISSQNSNSLHSRLSSDGGPETSRTKIEPWFLKKRRNSAANSRRKNARRSGQGHRDNRHRGHVIVAEPQPSPSSSSTSLSSLSGPSLSDLDSELEQTDLTDIPLNGDPLTSDRLVELQTLYASHIAKGGNLTFSEQEIIAELAQKIAYEKSRLLANSMRQVAVHNGYHKQHNEQNQQHSNPSGDNSDIHDNSVSSTSDSSSKSSVAEPHGFGLRRFVSMDPELQYLDYSITGQRADRYPRAVSSRTHSKLSSSDIVSVNNTESLHTGDSVVSSNSNNVYHENSNGNKNNNGNNKNNSEDDNKISWKFSSRQIFDTTDYQADFDTSSSNQEQELIQQNLKNQLWHCDTDLSWVDLGSNYFPQYIRNATCTSNTCWYGRSTCVGKGFYVKVLKRVSEKDCIPLRPEDYPKVGLSPEDIQRQIDSDEPFYDEPWIWEEISINVCCECALPTQSEMRRQVFGR